MSNSRSHDASRRRFLRQIAAASAWGSAPLALGLANIGAVSAQTAGDFRALVCVYLAGGNDWANTVAPYDAAGHAAYQAVRTNLAIPRDRLVATALASANVGARQFALHPSLAALKPLYDQNRLAIVANTGNLVQPITRAQYEAKSVARPPQLFSHSDQSTYFMTSLPDRLSTTGWGGRLMDVLRASNGNAVSGSLTPLGSNLFQSGAQSQPLTVMNAGVPAYPGLGWMFNAGTPGAKALAGIVAQSRTNKIEQQWQTAVQRNIVAQGAVKAAVEATPALRTAFPDSYLGNQMKTVAKMIAARDGLGLRRQVFYLSHGTYDHHDGLADAHPARLGELGAALAAFYAAMMELGVADKVTAFTGSEFGRGYLVNSRGSDHGWGGHNLVLGGSVRGGEVYGTMPEYGVGTETDAGEGRLIPTTSVDEYAATLARWMGIGEADLAMVVPNLGRFATRGLGFMA